MRRIGCLRKRNISHLPILVTTAILLVWHLFRISMFFSLSHRCYSTYEFWIASFIPSWPLFGSFTLVIFLLFLWNSACFVAPEIRTRTDRAILVFNAIALVAIGIVLARLIDVGRIEYYSAEGGYADWNRTVGTGSLIVAHDNPCEDAKPYLGTWDVVQADVPFRGQEFPFCWIEFRRDLTFTASEGRFSEPLHGHWSPPGHWRDYGWISTTELDGIWSWNLEGARLTLTTSVRMELPETRIILERRSCERCSVGVWRSRR